MEQIKGLIFDYGATLDTNGIHWAEVLWKQYTYNQVDINYEDFREAYVYGERAMAKQPLVKPTDNFLQVLRIKARLQLDYLQNQKKVLSLDYPTTQLAEKIALTCYEEVKSTTKNTSEIVKMLKGEYKLGLVSNFYGNIRVILKDFNLFCCFEQIIESSVVGIRKPDPAIYLLGVNSLELRPEEVIVIGDSYEKDIVPAHHIGCKTIWLRGKGWDDKPVDETLPDAVIHDLAKLPEILKSLKY